jgi:hypothetical protein
MLQNTIVAVAIAAFIGFLGGAWAGHTATRKTYELQISQERNAAKDAVILWQNKTINQERLNEKLSSDLDKLAAEYASKRDADAASLRKLLADRDSWVRSPVKCEAASTGTSIAASGGPVGEAQHGQLSREFQEYLVKELTRADSLIGYVNTCYGYVLEIEKQRERIMNDGKSTGNDN